MLDGDENRRHYYYAGANFGAKRGEGRILEETGRLGALSDNFVIRERTAVACKGFQVVKLA
ncbi:hypothetical protein PLANPX_1157 [Lacipirellula parvula]|uniref:Uncharacterized protein n=1 Tax=Lacipirellula parvula TaxID=2650471 RepID=A0A5K7X576_9BACT|nr:hypothetical protein PLANPX_1157 [Lacipirellula parvula]